MKLDEKPKDNIEISVKQKKQIEHRLLDKIVPHNNHTLFEIELTSNKIKKAEYSNTTCVFGEAPKREVIVKKNCVYISALNKKNALKKFMKNENGTKDIYNETLKL